MAKHDLQVTVEQANVPAPKKPDSLDPRAWLYYWTDLACWKATQADRRQFGIKERQ